MKQGSHPALFWVSALLLAICGFFLGLGLVSPKPREIDSDRVEACILSYINYRSTGDHEKLLRELEEISVSPKEFQKIIDRIIHYRHNRSAMEQAMKLLEAFRGGYDIVPYEVVKDKDEDGEEYFKLDAEILNVFKEKPELIQRAFEG